MNEPNQNGSVTGYKTGKSNLVGYICSAGILEGSLKSHGVLVAEAKIPGRGSVLPWYGGPYEVTPKAYDEQVLQTADKSMHDDVTVHKVPRYDVDNLFGGVTVSIAMEV